MTLEALTPSEDITYEAWLATELSSAGATSSEANIGKWLIENLEKSVEKYNLIKGLTYQ